MSWVIEPEFLALGIASIGLFATLAYTSYLGIRYQTSYDRLPAATRLSELETLVGGREAQLQEVTEELKRKQAALSERDQAEAEAEFWRAAAQTAKAEYEALADNRREIEKAREEYRQVLEELTLAETRLREIKADAEDARVRAEAAEERLKQIATEEETLRNAHVELRDAVAALEGQVAFLKEEKTTIAVEVERARERRLALLAETADLETSIEQLKANGKKAEAELADLRKAIDSLSTKKAEIEQVKRNLDELTRKHAALEQSVEEKERRENRLQARIAVLEKEIGSASGSDGESTDDRALADLTKPPACLATEQQGGGFTPVPVRQQAAEEELVALHRVMNHLKESGLNFSDRTVKAFHTSLKTAVISPLTVLAGISGTGKSQLPRYYADAMGIHFLKIPVQPRWDSPQDLFGFYNYIEKRYKATDLARALVHLDPLNWKEQAKQYQDRMLLVLLDEMNLARVEYYFSEFLSRLEGRPFDESSLDERSRRPSEIDIDVTQEGQGKRVYVGQNVLFVGTMNEDESTLALSDKVLDRANVMRFPKPMELKPSLPTSDAKHVAKGYLPKSRWMESWKRSANSLDASQRSRATDLIDGINDVMDKLGRPFGHRMGQAMLHYVANYPVVANRTNNTDQVNFSLADQIEQRILPRLRGIVVDEHARDLRDLADLADRQLADKALGEEIQNCIKRSQETNGLFVWRGFMREQK